MATIEVVLHPTSVTHYEVQAPSSLPPLIDPALGAVVGGSDALLTDDGGTSYGEVWSIGDDINGFAAFDLLGIELEQLVIPPGYELTGLRWFFRLRYPVAATNTVIGASPWQSVATSGQLSLGADPVAFQDDHFADGTLAQSGIVFWPNPFQGDPEPPVGEWFDYWYPAPNTWAAPDVFSPSAPLTEPDTVTLIAGNYRGGITTGGHANSVPQQITQFYIVCQLTSTGVVVPPRRLYPRPTHRVFPPPPFPQSATRFGAGSIL